MKSLLIFLLVTITASAYAQDHNSDTLFKINKKNFKIQTRDIDSEHVTLIILRDSKVIKTDTLDAGGLSDLKFPDFNKDGNNDIILTYMGNNFSYYLYLFDKPTNNFKYVDGFDRFPEATQLKANPKYYYSYHRAGCADENWVSDLFYIDNFKSIHIGQIYGKGCEADLKEDPQIIEIYKIINNKEENEKLIQKLPYLKNVPEYGDKWNFIQKYWGKNYLKFIPRKTTNR